MKISNEKRAEIESLIAHIEGHIFHMRDALAADDPERVKDQNGEIKGWTDAIFEEMGVDTAHS